MNVKFSHNYPPIPDRNFDWSAVIDGMEEDGPYGHGSDKLAAAMDLAAQWYDDVPDEFMDALEAVLLTIIAEKDLSDTISDPHCREFWKVGYRAAICDLMGIV